MNKNEPKWYVIYTRPRFEKIAYKLLIEKNITTYLPLKKTIRQWKDRKKKIEVPLIPSYLFVKIDLKDYLKVLKTEGVVKFIKFNNEIVPVPEWQINNIKIMLDEDVNYEEIIDENKISKGDFVEIISGKLKGIKGTVVYIGKTKNVIIRLDVLEKNFLINISKCKIKVIDKNKLYAQN